MGVGVFVGVDIKTTNYDFDLMCGVFCLKSNGINDKAAECKQKALNIAHKAGAGGV